jgi:glutaredoxin-like protein
MPLLDDNTKKEVGKFLGAVEGKVKLVYFDGGDKCDYCKEILLLLNEIGELNKNIEIVHNKMDDKAAVEKYGADNAPLIVLEGKNKGRVRFYGIPSGHEFGGFLATIVEVSKGDTVEFPGDLRKQVMAISAPLRLDVFVTPQCPYCPGAVRLAQAMAILNKNITGCGVEAMEFSEWADKNGVRSVPRTIVVANGKRILGIDGALAPDMLLNKIMEELG